ncbi:MAG: tRNA dihydrouridine synthase DusB [Syntrophaceae bacterium]|nr:tRNA dihydrouridine synthase DusB [Syntrophaceae bacterium]
MKIGKLEKDCRVLMAPMAGITNLPFRTIVREFGCDLAFTEMISAMGLVRGTVKSYRYLDTDATDRPLGVQIFGADPKVMAEAARIVEGRGADLIDINMGCPVKKVVRTGAGAALMKSPAKIGEILSAVRGAIKIPLTVKIRVGWNKGSVNAPEIAAIAADCGVDAVILHGRTAEQGYSGRADWGIIGEVKSRISIPVVGNGDLRSGADVLGMQGASGCDAFMVGRGALGYPWIFQEIIAILHSGEALGSPTLEERRAVIAMHLQKEIAYAGEKIGYRSFRKHLLWYTRGLRGGAHFRHIASRLTAADKMWEAFDMFLSDEDNLLNTDGK